MYTETCEHFTDDSGAFFQPKKCLQIARYCCGTCTSRYCCNSAKERLNQYDCKSLTGGYASNGNLNGRQNSSTNYFSVTANA
jgi:hypothetical protein